MHLLKAAPAPFNTEHGGEISIVAARSRFQHDHEGEVRPTTLTIEQRSEADFSTWTFWELP